MPNCHGLGSAAPAAAATLVIPSASAKSARSCRFSHVFNRNMRLLPLIRHGRPGAAFREGFPSGSAYLAPLDQLWRGNALRPPTRALIYTTARASDNRVNLVPSRCDEPPHALPAAAPA